MATNEDAYEATVSIQALLPWIRRHDAGAVTEALVGCELDDGSSPDLVRIDGVLSGAMMIVVEGGRRVNFRQVSQGAVVDRRPGHPLLAAIEGAKTPAERQEAQLRLELLKRRVDPDTIGSATEREQVLAFLRSSEDGELPAEPALRAVYDAMKKPAATSSRYRRAAEALQALMTTCIRLDAMPPSLPWRLAWFLNQSGQLVEAITVSETPQARAVQGMHRAYLATIRASALIALSRLWHDPGLLEQAEASLKTAYGIDGGSDEVKAVYRELNRAREQNEDGCR